MHRFRKQALAATLSLIAFGPAAAVAQDYHPEAPMADGKLTEEGVGMVLVSAQQQLVRLTEAATQAYQKDLLAESPSMPGAWLLMKDGETVKRINLDEHAQGAPAAAAIKMYRAAIKSIARRGHINAAAILYSGAVGDGRGTQALVIEHEHRLGVSANNVIGYEVRNGRIQWSEPVNQKKPYEWFYDSSDDAS